MRALAATGRTVVMSLHDAGLAARYADECWLLFGDGRWSSGSTGEVLDEESIGRLYGIAVKELRWNEGRTFVPA